MTITTAMTSVPKPAPALIKSLRSAPTSVISDNLSRLPGAVGLRPFHRVGKLVGTALGARTRPGTIWQFIGLSKWWGQVT